MDESHRSEFFSRNFIRSSHLKRRWDATPRFPKKAASFRGRGVLAIFLGVLGFLELVM